MPRRITPEASLLKACTDLLSAERIWWMRINTGAVKDGKRFFRFGLKGAADILALIPLMCKCGYGTSPLWIECKSATGRQSLHQMMFQRGVEEAGHKYLLIRDATELQRWLKRSLDHGR